MKFYTWKIPEMYAGYAVGTTREMTLCVIAKNIIKARKLVKEKINDWPSAVNLKAEILRIVREDIPITYGEGTVELF